MFATIFVKYLPWSLGKIVGCGALRRWEERTRVHACFDIAIGDQEIDLFAQTVDDSLQSERDLYAYS